jgi:hypothetical protein
VAKQRLSNQNEFELQKQINETVKQIQKNSKLKKQVETALHEWKSSREYQSAERGFKGAAHARQRLLAI